ncbi:MAG: NAD(P)/FAD-dependent oxidoreductase [Promethearchaeota archaeon]
MKHYDVIIVGAGPAGSMVAYNCAKAGLQTLLIDKARFPRDKPCGGAVSVRSLKALQLVGIKIPKTVIEQKIHGLQFMGPELQPFEYRSKHLIAYTVKRSKFDDYLANQAVLAGAQFEQECTLNDLEQSQDYVRCLTKKGQFVGRLVIGADGATSIVGRRIGLRKPMPAREVGIAIEVDTPINEILWNQGLDPSIILLWPLNIPYGYFWMFPRKRSLSFGVGGIARDLGNLPNMLQRLVHMFCEQYEIPPFRLHNIHGHQLPAFRNPIPLSSNRVLLAGDAAGFIDTFSGQGICYALEGGLICARAAIEIIKHNRPLSEVTSDYQTRITQRFGEELRFSWTIARLVHSHLYGGFRLARLMRWPGALLFDIAQGKTDYYRMKRNPLGLIYKLFMSELKARLISNS